MISWFAARLQLIAGGAIALLAIFIFGYALGGNNQKIKQAEAQNKLQQEADIKSEQLARDIADTRTKNEETIRLLQSSLDSAVSGLRNRPNRRLPTTTAPAASCAGSTGSELSSPDAEFLIREAADSDRWKIRLNEALDENEKLRQAMCVAATGKPCL